MDDNILIADVVGDINQKSKELTREVGKGNFEKIPALENLLKKSKKNKGIFHFNITYKGGYPDFSETVISNGIDYLADKLNCVPFKLSFIADPDLLNIQTKKSFVVFEKEDEEEGVITDFTAIIGDELFAYGFGYDNPPKHVLKFLGKEVFINKIKDVLIKENMQNVRAKFSLVDEKYMENFGKFHYNALYYGKDNKITFI